MGRYFSIQLDSKEYLDKIIVNKNNEGILIEGDFGDLLDLSLLEEKLFEVQFSNGVLRIEINQSEIRHITHCR